MADNLTEEQIAEVRCAAQEKGCGPVAQLTHFSSAPGAATRRRWHHHNQGARHCHALSGAEPDGSGALGDDQRGTCPPRVSAGYAQGFTERCPTAGRRRRKRNHRLPRVLDHDGAQDEGLGLGGGDS
eukprot:scaffold1398_cov259-Pinguiococcus_pyrenoidosus.AAC.8